MVKRGFMANNHNNRNRNNTNTPWGDRLIFSDGGNLLGSASGVPDTTPRYRVGETQGLSYAPVSDSLRDRWNSATPAAASASPWKTTGTNNNDKDDDDMMEEDGDTIATASTYPSTAPSVNSAALSSQSSSLATQPVLPHGKMMEAPRAVLYDWYLKEHNVQAVVKECYFTWHNNAQPHERSFTSIFVCPVTGELFATGRYGPKEGVKKRIDSITMEEIEERKVYYGQRKDDRTGATVVWYSDKTSSQHGAAARAYDCLSFRRYQPRGMRSVHLGDEVPYLTEQEAPPLPTMPNDIRNKVEAQRRRIATQRTQAASVNAPSPVAPKAALAAWYGTKPRAHQLSKNNYVSWNNLALPHLLKFTCVFVCPLSGEVFWSGQCGSVDSYEQGVDVNGNAVVWYNKKILAEHAAAARAYDCWYFRLEGRESNFLGKDEPYRSEEDAPTLPNMPTDAKERIRQLQEEAKIRMPIPILKPSLPMQTAEEEQQDRDAYRAARRSAKDLDNNKMNEDL